MGLAGDSMEDLTIDTSYITLKRGSIVVDQSDGTYPPFAIVQASGRAYRDPRVTAGEDELYKRAWQTLEIQQHRPGEKFCGKCGDWHLVADFDDSHRDGKYSWCKSCRRAYQARLKYEQREVERLMAMEQGTYRKPGRPRAA